MSESIDRMIREAVARERERCVQLCRERVELWRRSVARNRDVPPALEESRARANEAAFIADLLRSGQGADIQMGSIEN